MSDAHLGLFRVTRTRFDYTVVAAYSKEHAQQIAKKLDADVWQEPPTFDVSAITDFDDLPVGWDDILPHTDPAKPHLYPKLTCEQILSPEVPLIDTTAQHAIDQQLHGSIILRPPSTEDDQLLYGRYAVLRTQHGIHFTTLRPLPSDLKPFFVCYAMRPDNALSQ